VNENEPNSSYTAHCAVSVCIYGMLWRMPEMDAPRALVFRPLVMGNEVLRTRLPVSLKSVVTMRTGRIYLQQKPPLDGTTHEQLITGRQLFRSGGRFSDNEKQEKICHDNTKC